MDKPAGKNKPVKQVKNNLIFSSQDTLIPDALEEWLLALRVGRRSEKTLEFYQLNVGRFRWWAQHANVPQVVNEITPQNIRAFLAYLQTNDHRWGSDAINSNKKMSDASVQCYYRSLRAFFNFCEVEEFLEVSPFRDRRLTCPKARQSIKPSYTEDDVNGMLAACGKSYRDRAIIFLLYDTGIRASELCGLQLEDMEKDRLKVLGKGNKERYLLLNAPVLKGIRDYLRKERGPVEVPWLFLAKGDRQMRPNGLYQMIAQRAREAGVKGAGTHKFRHSFALAVSKSGASTHVLQSILGHESPIVSLRYGRMASGDVSEIHRQLSPVQKLQGKKR